MIDLVKVVKENLPYNVSLAKEPYKVTLADNVPYVHGYIGYVFHTRTVFSDGSSHEEMLFVSDIPHVTFHNAVSLFDARVKELSERCYWVYENDIIKEGFKV